MVAGRPPFRAHSTSQAEDFFVDSLAQWREAQGLDRMILVGHSLGGYLSACYALRHPEHISKLILVCPAGVVSISTPLSTTSIPHFHLLLEITLVLPVIPSHHLLVKPPCCAERRSTSIPVPSI